MDVGNFVEYSLQNDLRKLKTVTDGSSVLAKGEHKQHERQVYEWPSYYCR